LAKNFERSSCQRNNLAFAFIHFLVVGLDIPIGNSLDELDDIVRFGNQLNETLIVRLQKLQ
jgi:hypothetical protein